MELLIAIGVIAALAALWGLHRFLLWSEARGWIYYLRKQGGGSGVGNALLEVQSLLEPDRRPIVEEMRAEEAQIPDASAPPEPGTEKIDSKPR